MINDEVVDVKGKGSKKDLNRIIMSVAVAAMVILGMAVYLVSGMPPTFDEIMLSLIVVVVVGLAFVVIIKKYRSYKSGLPAEDEMSRKTFQKAGYYSWLFAIYAALISRFLAEEVAERTGDWSIVGSYMTIGVILGSALFFFITYFYLGRKGV